MSDIELEHPEVRLGRGGSDHISIRVLGRLHPGADDYWDGNWLVTPVEVVVGSFRGEVSDRCGPRNSEALEEVYASLSGEAVLDSMEEWLTMHIRVSGSGQVEVRGRAVDRRGIGNELRFELDGLDQSDLPEISDALRDAERLFPVVGKPNMVR